jgi:hypothetical protein
MDAALTCQILVRAETNCLISRSLYGLLIERNEEDLARLAWAAYLNSSAAAEACGESLGVATQGV